MDPATLTWAVFGVCATGFFFLLTRINRLFDQTIIEKLTKIEVALIGDMEHAGLITKYHEHDKEIKMIKVLCGERHATDKRAATEAIR